MLNPVLRKEIRVMFRGWKPFFVIAAYVLMLALITNLGINMISRSSYSYFDISEVTVLYFIILGLQMLAITFVVPALSGGSISGEREKQTLDLLLTTKMHYTDIIIGKLMGCMLMVCIMIVASMPVYAIMFYYGAMSWLQFLADVCFSLIYSMFLASIAICFSTKFKKTVISIVLTYLIVFFLAVGTPIIMVILSNYIDNKAINFLLLILNPIVNFGSIIDMHTGTNNIWVLILSDYSNRDAKVWIHLCYINAILNMAITLALVELAAHNINPIKGVKELKNE